jgi:TolB protein
LRRLLLAVLAISSIARAQERTYVDVGSPNFQPLPIAVADFQAEGDAPAAAVAAVVRSDLTLSGLFDVLDPKGFLADPREGFAAPSIRFTRWADVGADGLAKARVRRVGGELEGELHLYEVRAGREVLARTHRVQAADPRALAHRFADDIVRHYTREPGVGRRSASARPWGSACRPCCRRRRARGAGRRSSRPPRTCRDAGRCRP